MVVLALNLLNTSEKMYIISATELPRVKSIGDRPRFCLGLLLFKNFLDEFENNC